MPKFSEKCEITDLMIGTHSFRVCTLKPDEFDNLKNRLVEIVPNHYIDPQALASILKRLGKAAAAKKLLIKTPSDNKIRSGNIGEILASEYIKECTNYIVPIYKLRWSDHGEMAMRGDDVIGIYINQQGEPIKFLKCESKSCILLGRAVLNAARKELDQNNGLPSPHTLEFIADRLREIGEIVLSELIEKANLVDGIKPNQVEHLLFTFTESNPDRLQKQSLEAYNDKIKQNSVGFRVNRHQELIASVYQGVIDASNK